MESIKKDELPKWMQRCEFEAAGSYTLAAQKINRIMVEMMPDNKPVYLGRGKDTDKFEQQYAEIASNQQETPPNIFAFIGLDGIGRRTFAMKILGDRFQLYYYLFFEINEAYGATELYRKILDDNPEGLSADDILNYSRVFEKKYEEQEKAEEIARVFSIYNRNKICPILVDRGGMIDKDGRYKKLYIEIFKHFHEYPDDYLCVIQKRVPYLKGFEENLIFLTRLGPLDENSSYSVLDALLKQRGLRAERSQIKEIAGFLDGYPPAINYATKVCALYGVDYLYNDKTMLTEFKEGIFDSYIDQLQLEFKTRKIMEFIFNMKRSSIEVITIASEADQKETASAIRILSDDNLIECGSDGLYYVSPPVSTSIAHKVKRYNPERFGEIANNLAKFFIYFDEVQRTFDYIDCMLWAILQSGQNTQKEIVEQYALPSHFMEAARTKYEQRDWASAATFSRRVLELDESMNEARILLFKSLVRQEINDDWNKYEPEENKLLDELETHYDKTTVFYLNGFRHLKRKQYPEAIKCLRLSLDAGNESITAYRDLAEGYYQIKEYSEAMKQIDQVMKKKNIVNPYIVDLAAKIAIAQEDYALAEDYLRKQEYVDRPEYVAHRWASYYLKRNKLEEASNWADKACSGERVLPEMRLMRMNIASLAKSYDKVEEEYEQLRGRHSRYHREVLEVIYTTMLLQKDGWQKAEAHFEQIRGNSPYKDTLNAKIKRAKSNDKSVPKFQRDQLKEELKKQRSTFDPRSDYQCFDFR